MKLDGLLALPFLALLAACGAPSESGTIDGADEKQMAMDRENPLTAEWTTPFGVPPFDLIESADYLPALREGMQQQQEEIDAIANIAEAPTFENTIVALEVSGGMLSRIQRVFYAVNGAHSDDVIRETGKTIAPEVAAHRDDIFLNAALFERV